jgi:hypothetical protein
MIAFFASSACPTGWTEFTALQGRFLLGTPDGGTSGDSVGPALGAGESLTTSGVVAHAHNIEGGELSTNSVDLAHSHGGMAHAHNIEGGELSTDSADLAHSHGMDHTHEVDPPSTPSDEAETSGSSGCTSVQDKWNNSGGCHWGASCSSSYSVAACGSGSGTPHNHETDIPGFVSAGSSSGTTEVSGEPHDHAVTLPDLVSDVSGSDTEVSGASHDHTVTLPDLLSDASGSDAVDITPPYLQLMACIAP